MEKGDDDRRSEGSSLDEFLKMMGEELQDSGSQDSGRRRRSDDSSFSSSSSDGGADDQKEGFWGGETGHLQWQLSNQIERDLAHGMIANPGIELRIS